MNTDAKSPQQNIGKYLQQCIKRIIHYDHVSFIPEIKGCSKFKNQSLYFTTLTNKRKTTHKHQMEKKHLTKFTSQQMRNRGNFNLIKGMYKRQYMQNAKGQIPA